ncbi:MAG: FKBP-type peptidyl-prolyl cis-trans isomerase [Planctomycetota bacterium]|jgi:FKBP-type peptidyl-prolyl cis-trans isomerase|nr:peptidylprolyl isomerase [Planctomycetota bacterium]MDP6518967.1 FKBP-type peptidyl-prolyl cis-trans isomerase [Planctomycetota bacterium]MDP6837480.1 FKBP-type peptidyl-prolyl cis-trans isomerase [Planctomycetota bacterium]
MARACFSSTALLLALLPLASCGALRSWRHVKPDLVTQTLETGVIAQDLALGGGPAAALGDTLTMHYTGTFMDGSPLDSSRTRDAPLSFTLGEAPIPGWNEGLVAMRPGGLRLLTVPPERAYGEAGIPGLVPPDTTLLFEIELLSIGE